MSNTCLDEELASAFAQGSLNDIESSSAEKHIDSCQDCQQLVAMLAQLVTHTRDGGGDSNEPKLSVGDRVGRFSIMAVAGAGAMSVVYEAYDPDLDRNVALKLLRTGPQGNVNPKRAATLLAEARTLARLSHENIVVVHEVGTHAGLVFMAMEFIEGQTLSEWKKDYSPSTAEIVEVFIKAGRGLQAAHEAGLVHRDFKPDNVLIAHDGRVRVSDFGLAQYRHASPTDLNSDALTTHSNQCVGTPAYMPPEQWEGIADAASDQFSFCVALHESVCGMRPFAGETISEMLEAAKVGRIEGRAAPSWLGSLIQRGLANDPRRRFASMRELLAALHAGSRRRRRGATAVVALSALALAGVAGNALTPTAPASPVSACGDRGDLVQSLWSEQRKEQVRGALLQEGDPFAPAAWSQIQSLFDRYAREWTVASTDLCVRKQQTQEPPEIQTLMEQCLLEGLRDFRAVIAVLGEDQTVSASTSVKAAAKLRAPVQCMSAAGVGHRRPQLTDHEENRELQARAQALLHTAQYAASLAAADALVSKASAEGDLEAEVDGLLLSCSSSFRLDDLEKAEALCHRAALAASVPGYARERAHAWAILVGLVGGQQAHYEEAELWARYAQAALDESGGADEVEAILSNARGVIAKQQGQKDKAKDHYLRSIELMERAYGPEDLHVARGLNNLAILEGTLGEYKTALNHHERALAIKKEVLGAAHPSAAVSLMNIGLLYGKTDPPKALAYYQRSLAISDAALPPDHRYIAAALTNMANVEVRLGKYAEAQSHLERALIIFKSKYGEQHPRVAVIYEGLARAVQQRGELQQALSLHQQALAIREASFREPHEDVANSNNNLGFTLLRMERNREALVHFDEGLRLRRIALGDNHPDTVWDLLGVGVARRELGSLGPALAALEQAREILVNEENRDETLLADVAFEITLTLDRLGRSELRASELALQALAIYKGLPGQSGDPGVAKVEQWLGYSRPKLVL